ncbi:M28 family metallopeptidase [Natronospira bacteriovora]|uniref:M28 family metallopeptidase n=1 Tax=Natronospira bacteriovora TaxID=3069753 RepID=A0ABU0W9Z8_9GAMM|nr:M28 family metallopeptidase [Natronospira sp. AB-CW4]MDQ2070861.1 M28 family metallopeptidase [Natronospira sp. AB-CW4]
MLSRRLLMITPAAAGMILIVACGDTSRSAPEQLISEDKLHEHIAVLASDGFQGRAPATEGGRKTVAYLSEQLQALLLAPGNEGRYTQTVDMVSVRLGQEPELSLSGDGFSQTLRYGDEMMIWSPLQESDIEVSDSELVFVGYGSVAPEYDWDDYAGLDLEGKTVVMLVNDPGFASGDDALFNGRAMTYYGRWTYKFEEAARQGARGALIIHEDEAAGYGWEVVSGSWSGPQLALDHDGDDPQLALEGWLSLSAAEALFEASGHDLDALREAARQPGFEAVALDARARTRLENRFERSRSDNVIAYLPGSKRPDEAIIFTAHWDHLGVDEEDDSLIYNGAVDNASGTAAVLELARVFSEMDTAPERSIVFLLVTAEEQGLLGSRFYGENPVFPLSKTVAGINLDSMNVFGPTRDVTVVGYGNSALDEHLRRAAKAQGRHLRPEPHPERGYFYRSDHFSLARHGVPVLYPNPGIDHVERGVEFGEAWMADYQQNRYHRPADEYDPAWDLSGLALDTALVMRVALALANSKDWPNWQQDNEFRAIRDESRRAEKNH